MIIAKTLKDYLDNPMGSGSAASSNKALIKKDLDSRYLKLLEKKDIDIKVYRIGGYSGYIFHAVMPSETRIDGSYDVVLRLYPDPDNPDTAKDTNIKRYVMQVFSNCPSFTYTYAYVFNEYNMLIDILKSKYEKEVVSDNPIVRNPGEIINFEKSIYYTCKYILSHPGLTSKITLDPRVVAITKDGFIEKIRDIETISAEIVKENARLKAIKAKNKDDLANLKEHKDYTKEKNLDKLKVETKKDDIANIKKVSYYRRQKLKPVKKVSSTTRNKITPKSSTIKPK